MSSCICKSDEKLIWDRKCPRCQKEFKFEVPSVQLPYHCPKCNHVAICGLPEPICDSCTQEGWICVSAYGGPPFMKNLKTEEEYYL